MTYLLTTLAGSSALLFLTMLSSFAVEFSGLNLKTKEKVGDILAIVSATLIAVPGLILAAALAFKLVKVTL